MKKSAFSQTFIILCFIISAFFLSSFSVNASGEEAKSENSGESAIITGTLNLSDARQNLSGPGYYWNNPAKTLTFNKLTIRTEDDFGIKIPSGATIVLEGENHITAGKYGLSCSGSVTFKGEGSLIVDAGDYALYFYSSNGNNKVKFLGGRFTLSGGECGIYSPVTELSIISGRIKILSSGENAVFGNIINILGGENEFSGNIYANHLIKINGANLKVVSSGSAIHSENLLDISNEKILAGASEDNMTEVESYNDEACVDMTSTYKRNRGSIIFGDNVQGYVDFIILFVVIAVIAAVILIPVLMKKRRTRLLYERLEKEEKEKE